MVFIDNDVLNTPLQLFFFYNFFCVYLTYSFEIKENFLDYRNCFRVYRWGEIFCASINNIYLLNLFEITIIITITVLFLAK